MFAKLQLDSNCFLGVTSLSKSSSLCLRVSIPTNLGADAIVKFRDEGIVETSQGVAEKLNGDRRSKGNQKTDIVFGPELEFPDRRKRRTTPNGSVTRKGKTLGVEFSRVEGHAYVSKEHTKCSTKWYFYRGSTRTILQALDTVKDLDEALNPWELTLLDNKVRSIILKEQLCWDRALEIFEWFRNKRCYELNVIHYNIMLKVLGKAKKWSLVESLCQEMEAKQISFINSTYGTLIDVYSKGGLKETALSCLEKMNQQGMQPDEVTTGIVMQMYKKAGEFQKVQDFFKRWTPRYEGNSKAYHKNYSLNYNTLIDTYGKSGQIEEASKIFAQMLKEGIVPSTVTFNTMIHICGNNGHLDEVTSLLEKMQEIRCPLDSRTYSILISLYAKHDDIDFAALYFRRMKEDQLEPNCVAYRTLLYAFSIRHMVTDAEDLVSEMDEKGLDIDEYTQSALTRMYIESGMLEKSWLWFRRFHLAGNMTSRGYAANIDAYGERGHILEAESVFSCSQENGKLSILEFNVMIKAYGFVNNYDDACQLFDSIQSHDVIPDKCSYGTLLQILARADLPDKVQHYLKRMQEQGLVSDCFTYCAVISCFAKLGRLGMAKKLYKEMIELDVKPDVVVYGVLINACADAGNVVEAMEYMVAMKETGLAGNAIIYSSLIKMYTKVGYLKEAEETYKELMSWEDGPDGYCSNCMIDLYSRKAMVKQAQVIFERMKKKGEANEFSYSMMMCMYKRLGRFEEASEIAGEMRNLRILSKVLSYNNVIDMYSLDKRFSEAIETFKEMLDDGVRPDKITFKSLGLVLLKCGISKKTVGRLKSAVEKDYQSGVQAWLIALYTMVDADR
ncbi:Pentatricopeptide repeat-containing protein At3g23020 [Linum perenne]